MVRKLFSLFIFCILLSVGCSENVDDSLPMNISNINYNPNNSQCIMDIYRNDQNVRPAVMLIHGGAWITFPGYETVLGKIGMVQFKDQFLNNGYHVVNIDYRLINIVSPDDTNYKDMLDDIKSAVQFLYDHSDYYKINTSKIVMYGYSAGAHLAELYSYKVTDSPIPVSLCVGRAGPADFWNVEFRECNLGIFSSFLPEATNFLGLPADASQADIANAFRIRLITNLLGIQTDETDDLNVLINDPQNEALINDISPIYHVTSSSPRTILLHGKQDTLVPYSMAVSLDAKLTECDVTHDFITLPHSDHLLNNSQDSAELQEFDSKVLAAIK